MSIPEFTDPRQVVIYDAVNSYEAGTQPDFYLGVAEEIRAETVVDLGCGTGIVTLEFASRGYRMIAVDPSPVMLKAALQKPGADSVQWVQGDAGQLGTPGADLAFMSGHVAQFILKDADWLEALAGVKEALRPGGYFAFESRDPRAREWDRWTGRKRIIPDSTAWVTWFDGSSIAESISMTYLRQPLLADCSSPRPAKSLPSVDRHLLSS